MDVPGLCWDERGLASLSGAALALLESLDQTFRNLAREWDAEPVAFPVVISAAELQKVDYFGSFPHLATFAAVPAVDDDGLAAFAADPIAEDGAVRLGEVHAAHVLSPAACYHLYIAHQGAVFDRPRWFTTRATCFRRETEYRPLERQWSFTMREVVAMGTREEVQAFLAVAGDRAGELADALGLGARWENATDPFFRPSRNPKYLMQRVDPTKQELVVDDDLAIASVNLHHDHFGRSFGITRAAEGSAGPVVTGCLAFGVERWVAAVVKAHGPDPANWPAVASAPLGIAPIEVPT